MPTVPEIHLAGTGSFAADVAEYAAAAGLRVAGLVEPIDDERVGRTFHGFVARAPSDVPGPGAPAVVAAGGDRVALWARLDAHGWTPATIVHPAAHVSPSAEIARGCVVGPGAVVGAEARVGEHVLIGRGALVGHHVALDAGVVMNPGANVAALTQVGSGTRVGMGAVVVNGLRVGGGATIAAGAVVVRDVAAGARVQGVPARPYGPGS
jgi:sugar O-acyltransferase (sialic acid O-acetyltransferase NeuD family)